MTQRLSPAPASRRGSVCRKAAALLAVLALLAAAVGFAVAASSDPAAGNLALGWQPSWRTAAAETPLEAALFADAADGALDRFSLAEAALIAEGLDAAALAHWTARLDRFEKTLSAELADRPAAEEAAARIFHFLHTKVLTGQYALDCSEVSRSLATGDYNCVTATILYHHLAAPYELPLAAVVVPGHVRSRLLAAEPIEVETTYPAWFEWRRNRKPGEAVLPPTAPRREPLSSAALGSGAAGAQERLLSPVELVGKVYYNRGVQRLDRARYAEAVTEIEKALRLDPLDAAGRENLLAALNNWALDLCQSGRFEEAVLRIEQGLRLDPAYGPLSANDLHVHHQWVLALCDRGRYDEAVSVLERASARRPDAELFRRGRDLVRQMQGEALVPVGGSF